MDITPFVRVGCVKAGLKVLDRLGDRTKDEPFRDLATWTLVRQNDP